MLRARRPASGLAAGIAALLLGVGAEAAPLVEAEPSRVVLRAGTQVRISVRGAGGELHGVASAGTLVAAGSAEGVARFLWLPPEGRAPFVALLAFWESGPLKLRSVTTLTLPCSGRTELAIDTEPGARITVEIAGAHFGPRRADARGKLRMPVEVAPQAREARITAEVGEQSKVRVVPLPASPNPWVWLVEPAPLPARSEARAMLLAPEPIEPGVLARGSGGLLEREASEQDRVLYRLAPLPGAQRIALEASLAGEPAARATTTVEVLPPPAEAPAAAPAPAPVLGRLEIGAALGAFFAGGGDAGPAFTATLSVAPWRIPLYVELELGIRAAWFSSDVAGLGTTSSALVVFPIDLAVRVPVWSSAHWRVDLRVGGGLLVGTNWVSSSFGQGFSQAATGWELFGAVQLAYRAGAFLPYAELRGAYALVTGSGLTANPGGLVVLVGFHWLWRPR